MKSLLIATVFFFTVLPVQAFTPVVTTVDQPYEIVTIEESETENYEYLGELTGFPLMYEVTRNESFSLNAQLQQRYVPGGIPLDFSMIVIRRNERGGGVTEIARLSSSSTAWTRSKSTKLGMSVWESPILTAEVEPGTYQIEVSTPDNDGKYLLYMGNAESDEGYFQTLGGIYTTQRFFGLSLFSLLLSSYVYYPLGVLILLLLIHKIWKYRTLISANVS